jgi:hypothetical protein
MSRAILLALVTLASGLLLYLLLAPRFVTPTPIMGSPVTTPNAQHPTPDTRHPDPSNAPTPNANINASPGVETPRTGQQRETDDREARRGVFYRWIRENLSGQLVGWQPDPHDPATLELYTLRDNPQEISQLLATVVQPHAYHYGFNHVKFYLPNPPGGVDHYRLDAEAQYDNGVWQLFRK